MPKGTDNKLLLKRELLSTRDKIKGIIYTPAVRSKLSLEEVKVYNMWLDSTEKLIKICEERNKF